MSDLVVINDLSEIYPGGCPNMSSREGWDINMITIHFTKGLQVFRGDGKGTAEWVMWDEDADASAHLYGERTGTFYRAVPYNKRAWHHGKSQVNYHGKNYTHRTDRCAVGIELANCGHMVQEDDGEYYFTFGKRQRRYPIGGAFKEPVKKTLRFSNGIEQEWFWEPYPEPLVLAATRLTADLVSEFDVPIRRIVGHEDVALPEGERKLDPGPMWDWKTFIPNVCDLLGTQVPDDVWRLHKTVS